MDIRDTDITTGYVACEMAFKVFSQYAAEFYVGLKQ